MKHLELFENFTLQKTSYDKTISDILSRIDKDQLKTYREDNNWEESDLDDYLPYFLNDEYSISVTDDGIIEFYTLDNNTEELIGENPVIMYHFTSSKLVPSIKKNGLVTGLKKTNPYKNSYSGIYLTTKSSGNDIDGYKYHAVNKHKGEAVKITIKMYLSELAPDSDDAELSSGKYQFMSENIPPDRIIDIEEVR